MLLEWVVVLWCGVGCAWGRAPPLQWRAHRDVTTRQGLVRGFLGLRHWTFLGIPYASPPTHTNRFKAPEVPPAWDGVFEATYRVRCPQQQPGGEGGGGAARGEENCLAVNVFTPEHAGGGAPLPVFVHLHHGGFHEGWGSLQPPARLIQEFVVVTFNYRLGALGFLCLGTPEAPGNAGLKDQVAALYWVQENIHAFGGNSDDVTLYGTGVGAISIQLLLLSGLTRGLFHKVIMESGSVLEPSSLAYDPLATGIQVAASLGNEDNGNVDELVEFYQKLPLSDITNVSTNFLPCVENSALIAHSLIDRDPRAVLKSGSLEKLPTLIMYTSSKETRLIAENHDRFTAIPAAFEDLLPNNLEFENENTKYKIADLVKSFYFEQQQLLEDKIINNYKEYINDIFMEYPIHKFAALYASTTSVPVYVMRFTPDEEGGAGAGAGAGRFPDIYSYISRADDYRDEDSLVADRLVSLLVNFIKIGDPTPLTSALVPVLWEPLNPHGLPAVELSRPCLHLGHTISMQEPQATQRLLFWDHIYDKYYRKHTFDGE